MKIKDIAIKEYGPLNDIVLSPGSFDCFFGLNEAGKTALVEVLTYTIFKKNVSMLRYRKPKQVSITVEHNKKIYSLPGKKLPAQLAPSDVASLLYVRASDSSLYSSQKENRFWDTIKTMFTNIRGGITFAQIDTKLFETIELQPVRAEWEKNKLQRITAEQQRAEELHHYIQQIDDIVKKETTLKKVTQEQNLLAKKLEKLEAYQKYKSYQEVSELYSVYRDEKVKVQDYERYKYDYLGEWEKLIIKKASLTRDGEKVKDLKEEIISLEKELMEINRKDDFINVEGLKTHVTRSQEDRLQIHIAVPLIVLLFTTILALISFFTPLSKIFSIGLWFMSVGFLLYTLYRKYLKRKYIAQQNEWFRRAQQLFPGIMNVQDLQQKIEEHEKKKIQTETLLHEKKTQKDGLKDVETITMIERHIADMHRKTGLAEIEDLKVKLQEKRTIEDKIHTLSVKVGSLLEEKDDAKWERLIQSKKVPKPESTPDTNTDSIADLQERNKILQKKINTLQNEITVFQQIQQTKFNIKDDRSVFVEYSELQHRLQDYELEKKAALMARSILQEMSTELDEYITDMLEGDESIGEYFEFITGKYINVNLKNNTFIVKDKTGNSYDIDKLSSGAKDQLLLCFRLVALRKIYPKGSFLILDDAFIFADWDRRKSLTALLKKYIEDGNQVLYLTSDDHTRDLLQENGARIITL